MKAVGYRMSLPISDPNALLDVDLPKPVPTGRDPPGQSRRGVGQSGRYQSAPPRDPPPGEVRVLGCDAAGMVSRRGPDATLFKPGDAVFYAGAHRTARAPTPNSIWSTNASSAGNQHARLGRSGGPAAHRRHRVGDAVRSARRAPPGAGRRPRDPHHRRGRRRRFHRDPAGAALTDLTVIATASRPETREWVRELGAASCHRPCPAAGRRGRRARPRRARRSCSPPPAPTSISTRSSS